jgi:hypothetical protein
MISHPCWIVDHLFVSWPLVRLWPRTGSAVNITIYEDDIDLSKAF